MRLVEDITGLTGLDEVVLTLREAEPLRITRAQVRNVCLSVSNDCTVPGVIISKLGVVSCATLDDDYSLLKPTQMTCGLMHQVLSLCIGPFCACADSCFNCRRRISTGCSRTTWTPWGRASWRWRRAMLWRLVSAWCEKPCRTY